MPRKKDLQTEFAFTLPIGLIDNQGRLQRQGLMRLATAKDELFVYQESVRRDNESYDILLYLSQVILRLGNLVNITPKQLENLYLLDLRYLTEFYNRINQHRQAHIPVECPHCQNQFSVEFALRAKS